MGITQTPVEEMTEGQKKQLTRLIMDQLEKSGNMHKAGVDRILARGDQLTALLLSTFIRLGAEVAFVNSNLLEAITIASTPAVEIFSTEEKFKVGTQDGVKIGYVSYNFKGAFLSNGGKTEANVSAQSLRVHKLCEKSYNKPIFEELGGHDFVEINLACMWEMMKKQGQGKKGDLLTNGYANIFCIRDSSKTLWAVYCDWRSNRGYWDVGAFLVTDPSTWRAGYRLFSR